MKITKFIHSCLLLEDTNKVILFDPGNYTRESHSLDDFPFSKLDAIAITHEHPDHMDIPLIKRLLEKFPKAEVFCTMSSKAILEKEGIQSQTKGNDFISMTPVPHEKIFMGPSPENMMITYDNKFATPGDSLTFSKSPEILALPVQAPWGSTTWATETALHVMPKVIVPIHDWHWKDEVRIALYNQLEEFFAKHNIIFKKPETGISFEV